MRMSDWSSDVCSSDLSLGDQRQLAIHEGQRGGEKRQVGSWSGTIAKRNHRSNPGIPFISCLIFPIAALAKTSARQLVHRLDFHDVFGMLIAKLTLNAQAERRAMTNIQRLVVECEGHDRLRMQGVDQVNAFIKIGRAHV